MDAFLVVLAIVVVVLLGEALSVRIVKEYLEGVLFRLGGVVGTRDPGLRLIVPFIDNLRPVSLRIVTMAIQSQGIVTRDNVNRDVSAVAYCRIVDPVKSVTAIDQIARATLRKIVGQHMLDETSSETSRINLDIREILDRTTTDCGVDVTLVELKDIQLPESMKWTMAGRPRPNERSGRRSSTQRESHWRRP
jgi:regulator of protease activity HflC (stomatin/prohibitin superfamily)